MMYLAYECLWLVVLAAWPGAAVQPGFLELSRGNDLVQEKTGDDLTPTEERESKAGEKMLQQLKVQQKAEDKMARFQMDMQEKMMKTMLGDGSAKQKKEMEKQMKERRVQQEKTLKANQAMQKRLMKDQIECAIKVPGDQSGTVQKELAKKPQEVCKSEKEQLQMQEQYKAQKLIQECMKPAAKEESERALREQFKDSSKEEYAAMEHQLKVQQKMQQDMAQNQLQMQDRMMKKQLQCMKKVCATKAAKKENDQERRKREQQQMQECVSQVVMQEYAGAMKNAVKELTGKDGIMGDLLKGLHGGLKNELNKEKAVEQKEKKASTNVKVLSSKATVTDTKVTQVKTKVAVTKTKL